MHCVNVLKVLIDRLGQENLGGTAKDLGFRPFVDVGFFLFSKYSKLCSKEYFSA